MVKKKDEVDIDFEDVAPQNVKPSLYDINRSFDVVQTENYNGIVGEEKARMVIFTNFILGEKPCILKGSRASGKTNTMKVVGVYSKNPIDIASSSEKVYSRMKDLNNFSHFFIPEINKVHEKTVDMLKDWGEGEKHQYTFMNQFKEPETIVIDSKPFITSIADENKNVDLLGEELLSRMTVVRTDSSVAQNIRVIEEKMRRAENPFYKKDVDQSQVKQFIDFVKALPSIRNYKFVHLGASAIRTAIPPLFTDSRRDTDKYLANTYGITLFHYHDRMKVSVGNNDYLLVTPADMWYNHVIYQDILLESSLKCGRIESEILEILKEMGDRVKQDDWGNTVRGLKVGEIHTELLRRSFTPTIASTNKYCNSLMEIGYVTRNDEVKPYRFSLNPELKREYKVHVDWKEVVDYCKVKIREVFPELADEYIRRFCVGEGLVVTHPFTGERINLVSTTEPVDDAPVVVEAKKKAAEQTAVFLERMSEPQVKVDKVDIDLEVQLDEPESVEDEQDAAQQQIVLLLSDNKTRDVTEIAKSINKKEEMVEDVLAYLKRIGEVFEERPSYYRRL